MGLILLIVVIALLFGGGGGYYAHNNWGGNPLYTGSGILVPILIILFIVWLVRGGL